MANHTSFLLNRKEETLHCLALWLLGLCFYLALVWAANSQQILTGEEASVAFKDILFLELRLQHDRFDTNLGGHMLFWLGSFLTPGEDLFYGRFFKTFVMSSLGAICYLLLRQRLKFQRLPATLGSLLLMTLPGVVAFSWIAIEAGLDLLIGMLALYLALSTSWVQRALGSAVLGFGLIAYGATVAFLPSFASLIALAVFKERSWQSVAKATVCALLGTSFILLPRLWWLNTHHTLVGGGFVELNQVSTHLRHLIKELFVQADSYYFFSRYPALGHWGYALLGLLGFAFVFKHRRDLWPVLLVLPTALVLYSIAGGVIGFRRVICLCFILAVLVACAAEWIWQDQQKVKWKSLTGVLMLLIVTTGTYQTVQLASAYVDHKISFPVDFTYPSSIDGSMVRTTHELMVSPTALQQVLAVREPIRALTILSIIARRQGVEAPGGIDREFIRRYYFEKDPERFK